MAEGSEHAVTTKRVGCVLTLLTPTHIFLHSPSISTPIGLFLGHIITPDIGHHKVTYEEQRMIRLNRLWGYTWVLFWTPYELLNRHRSRSVNGKIKWNRAHWIGWGTFERYVYLLWLPIWKSLEYCYLYYPEWQGWLIWFWVYIYIGWFIQDCVHIWKDL